LSVRLIACVITGLIGWRSAILRAAGERDIQRRWRWLTSDAVIESLHSRHLALGGESN
jgi:hypothetical protein